MALMAAAIGMARCLNVEPGGIDRSCRPPRPGERTVYILANFIHAHQKDHTLRPPCDGCDSIAIAVNVDHHTVLADGIDTGEIEVALKGLAVNG